jgi:hypothetical protein
MNGSQEPRTPSPEGAAAQEAPQEPAGAQAAYPPPPSAAASAAGFFQVPRSAQDPRAKSPALACFLSIVPGLGQVYTGYYVRGFVHAITVATIITLLATGDTDDLTPFLALFMAFFWLHNIIDAGRRATFYNQMLAGGSEMEAFPPEMKMPGLSGSIFAGLGLIEIGGIALSYTRYGMSLAWIEDWWPVAPILIGVYLVALAVRDRMRGGNEA